MGMHNTPCDISPNYVCLDDDSDFLPGQPLVKTDGVNGISAENYYKALEFLGVKESRGLRIGVS